MTDKEKIAAVIGKIISFLFLALAVINLLLVITVSAVMPPILFVVVSIISFLVSLKRQHTAKEITAEILTLLFLIYFMFFTLPFSGNKKWQYPFQRWYIEFMANDDTNGFFPDKLPDNAENFRTEYTPPLMQGSGYYYICFNTDNIDEYKAYTENALLSFTMGEFKNGLSDENAAIFKKHCEDGFSLDYYVDIPECIDKAYNNTEIHIINSNFSWNHPHTDIIFINYDKNMVCFSSVG